MLSVACVCLFVFTVPSPCAAQSWYDHYPYKHLDISWNWGHSDIPQPDFSRFPPKPTSLQSSSWSGGVVANGLDLSGRDLRNARIHLLGGTLRNINFDGANLEGAVFCEVKLENCSFRGANLRHARMIPSPNCDMTDAILGGTAALLTEKQMQSTWNFKNKDFSNTFFTGCRFPDTEYDSSFNFANTFIILSHSSLDYTGAFFYCCNDIYRSYSSDNDGPSAEGLCSLPEKIKFDEFSWNQLPKGNGIRYTAEQAFRTHEFRQKSLSGLTIEGVDFSGSDFSGFTLGYFENCNFEGANFKDASILSWQLRFAPGGHKIKFGFKNCRNLTNDQLDQSRFWKDGDISRMVLEGMDLDGWDFSNKNLTSVSFVYSTFRNTNFEDAYIYHTDFTQDRLKTLTAEQLQQTRQWKTKSIFGCRFQGVNFDNQDLSGFKFPQTRFIMCSFRDTNLAGANLEGAVMTFTQEETVRLTEEQIRSLINFREDMLRFVRE